MSAWDSALSNLNTSVRDTFGQDVAWRKNAEAPVTVKLVASESQSSGEATPPNYQGFWGILSDFPTVARGDIISTTDGTFRVLDVDPDGGGGVRLTTEKVPTGWLPIETNIQPSVIIATGVIADRPPTAREGDMYVAEDEDKIYVWFD